MIFKNWAKIDDFSWHKNDDFSNFGKNQDFTIQFCLVFPKERTRYFCHFLPDTDNFKGAKCAIEMFISAPLVIMSLENRTSSPVSHH